MATLIEFDSKFLLNEQVTELNMAESVELQARADSEVGRVTSGGN